MFIDVRACGIHMLCLVTDGMTLTTFKGTKQVYIRVNDAIEWHEKEMLAQGRTRADYEMTKVLDKLLEIKDQHVRHLAELAQREQV